MNKADNIDYLPIWKKGATASEHFYELFILSRKHPERFTRTVVIYQETLPNGNTLVRQISNNCNTTELIGLIELGKQRVIEETQA